MRRLCVSSGASELQFALHKWINTVNVSEKQTVTMSVQGKILFQSGGEQPDEIFVKNDRNTIFCMDVVKIEGDTRKGILEEKSGWLAGICT